MSALDPVGTYPPDDKTYPPEGYTNEDCPSQPEAPRPWSSPSIEAICGALAAVQAEIEGIPLDSANPFFKSRYASLGAVISQSKAALAKHGLAIVQVPSLRGDFISLETRVVHKSGQWLEGGVIWLFLYIRKALLSHGRSPALRG